MQSSFLKGRIPEFIRQESRSTDNREGQLTETGNPERTEVTGGADGPAEISVEKEKREGADE